MNRLVDAECVRHIHTDSKDAFYLGAVTADIRASDMAFQKTMKCTPYIFRRRIWVSQTL